MDRKKGYKGMILKILKNKILNGKLNYHQGCLYGNYQGFYISIIKQNVSEIGEYRVVINACSIKDQGNTALKRCLERWIIPINWIKDFDVSEAHVSAILNLKGFPHKSVIMLNRYLKKILTYLIENKYTSGCEECGDTDVELFDWGGRCGYFCQSCADKHHRECKENLEMDLYRSNLLGGTIAALGAGILLILIWVLIGYYISLETVGCMGILVCLAVEGAFNLGGEHMDDRGRVCALIVSTFVIFLANRILVAWLLGYGLFGIVNSRISWKQWNTFRKLK